MSIRIGIADGMPTFPSVRRRRTLTRGLHVALGGSGRPERR